MGKIGICGHFNFGNDADGGQTIKTRLIAEELIQKFGKDMVICIDTKEWYKNPVSLFLQCLMLSVRCCNIIVLPAHNGVKVFIPLFVFLSRILRKKLHYIVIGAWLADELSNNKLLLRMAKGVSWIYVETETLKNKLKDLSLTKNVRIMHNFKTMTPLDSDSLNETFDFPYRVCMFSRLNYEKGVEDAVEVVNLINRSCEKQVLELDLFGPIETGYKNQFYNLVNEYSDFVTYKGIVDYNKTIDVLKDYYLLLFPTKYYTEGIPGTLLDAYMSGVPILASRWESYRDVVRDGETGMTYMFDNKRDFYDKLKYLVEDYDLIMSMKRQCIKEAYNYTAEKALEPLFIHLGG